METLQYVSIRAKETGKKPRVYSIAKSSDMEQLKAVMGWINENEESSDLPRCDFYTKLDMRSENMEEQLIDLLELGDMVVIHQFDLTTNNVVTTTATKDIERTLLLSENFYETVQELPTWMKLYEFLSMHTSLTEGILE